MTGRSDIPLVITMPPHNPDDSIVVTDFDAIRIYALQNPSGMTVKVTNYGAIITSILVPDRNGDFADVALGYNDVADYINAVDKPYFGAIVGRYGNRIANGKFSLDGADYELAKNNGQHHLHGGIVGFDKVVWDAAAVHGDGFRGITLDYLAKDGEEHFPGNLTVRVIYRLFDDNRLTVEYLATTDQATPVNLTQHTYFNLKGEGEGTILDHELMLNASGYTPVDATLIPTGTIEDVSRTPFDFRQPKLIGQDIDAPHQQLEFGGGYDHNFVIDGKAGDLRLAARVTESGSGRILEVHTQEPGLQLYCGNFLDGRLTGKAGKPYVRRGGLCLETQHFPDSPNQPEFPSTVLRPGETYRTQTVFTFGTDG